MREGLVVTACILVVAYCLLGCFAGKDHSHIMVTADKMIENHPDSALRLMRSIDTLDVRMSDDNRAFYYLLLTQAQYKCHKPLTVANLIDFSIAHYKSEGDDELLARACYYRAMGYYESQHYPEALPLLKEGEAIATNLHNEELLSKFYESLVVVNRENGTYPLMLRYARLFTHLSIAMDSVEHIARGYNAMYYAFDKMDQIDSSHVYMEKALSYVDRISSDASILANAGCMYLRRGDYAKSKRFLLKSLEAGWRYNIMWALGEIYRHEGHMDKAEDLCLQAMRTDEVRLRIEAMESYGDLLLETGRGAEACQVWKEACRQRDSLYGAQHSKELADFQLEYDLSKMETRHQRQWSNVILLVGLLVVGLIVSYVSHKRRENRLKILNAEERGRYVEMAVVYTGQIDTAQQKNGDLLKEITNITDKIRLLNEEKEALAKQYGRQHEQEQKLKEEAQVEIDKLKQQTEAYVRDISQLHRELDNLHLYYHNRLGRGRIVYDKIVRHVCRPAELKDKEDDLILYFSVQEVRVFLQWKQITREKRTPTCGQYVYLILIHLKYTDTDICALKNISASTLRNAKHRLRNLGFDVR